VIEAEFAGQGLEREPCPVLRTIVRERTRRALQERAVLQPQPVVHGHGAGECAVAAAGEVVDAGPEGAAHIERRGPERRRIKAFEGRRRAQFGPREQHRRRHPQFLGRRSRPTQRRQIDRVQCRQAAGKAGALAPWQRLLAEPQQQPGAGYRGVMLDEDVAQRDTRKTRQPRRTAVAERLSGTVVVGVVAPRAGMVRQRKIVPGLDP